MGDLNWNATYVDRRTWILENLEYLQMDVKEAMVILVIDYLNTSNLNIDHEIISKKLKLSIDEIEDIFGSLSDKGYLTLNYSQGKLSFNISGLYDLSMMSIQKIDRSLIQEFELEFSRSLSSQEMQRILDLSSEYGERMVLCALNEAACNDVHDLNYIEKILITWQNKGLSAEDVENGKR